jgi:mono/diheme cytochrome c family protein
MRVLLAALLLAAAPAAAQQADLNSGRWLATQWCANCHQITAQTGGPRNDSAPSFAAIAARPGATQAGIATYVRVPHANMPDHGLTPRQANDVAAFLLAQKPR